ncbi:VIT1/CCC1 transporter family protein [Acinetobacter sp. ANC 4641]|uniref:VIT1/CCC1 transporter family protein n=1 Tax=Acinetobacter sp. ANC 4641 TaxID=2529847 RepID=UPI00103F7DA8|nr:VIT family protein [Acinetobacter sp. ANC 4641]TCB12483.1 VIT family protein [Acinetobacter sp. ANC 4641]
MTRHSSHPEKHYTERSGWLRAAVLGANDGIISVTSLVIGIAASGATAQTLLVSCIAGLISGAVSMAAGEYISVKSQQDIEQADLKMEAHELHHNPDQELKELTRIYIQRGLDADLAVEVAKQLTAHDALQAHARDEIGIFEQTLAQPLQAAFSSAFSFSLGAVCPLFAILIFPAHWIQIGVGSVGIVSLGILGALASYVGGNSVWKGALRVVVWGILAMLFSFWVGSLFDVDVH